MTVRAWFTISGIVLFALTVAVVLKLTASVQAPTIVVRSGSIRLDGKVASACWPQRSGNRHCVGVHGTQLVQKRTVPRAGAFRIVVAYPIQPKEGSITLEMLVSGQGRVVEKKGWTQDLPYHLEAGTYALVVEARYSKDADVTYTYLFRVA